MANRPVSPNERFLKPSQFQMRCSPTANHSSSGCLTPALRRDVLIFRCVPHVPGARSHRNLIALGLLVTGGMLPLSFKGTAALSSILAAGQIRQLAVSLGTSRIVHDASSARCFGPRPGCVTGILSTPYRVLSVHVSDLPVLYSSDIMRFR
ncbi:hypothetical protein C8R47DRAFT_658506 [Mycena vitilis]|nr:hypothetical protein C8R47DRAFT_658506 [Mycena vitilis]